MSDFHTDAAGAGRRHHDLAPELRALAQAILDRVDPAVRLLAARAVGNGSQGACQQVWCPVCALAALVNGEEHPLLSVVAEHSVALLTVLRAVLDDAEQQAGAAGGDGATGPDDPPDPPPPPGPPPSGPGSGPAGPGRYQHIPVTVDE